MLQNYLKIAVRNLQKRAFYSFLNIAGLAVGITFALLIGSYVWGEFQVNRTLRHAGQQYILLSHWKNPNMGQEITTLAPLAKRLKEEYPTLIANYYRWDGLTSVISNGNKRFREGIQLGDNTLLSMYGFETLHGNAQAALERPFSVVISAEKALIYFGRTDVVGQTVDIQNFSGGNHPFTITAVLKDIAENSVTQINATIRNTFFIPTNTYTFFNRSDFDSWQNGVLPSYIELNEGISPAQLKEPIQRLIDQNTSPLIRQNLRVEPIALTDYYRQKENGLVNRMLFTLSLAGLFILLMAIVNFVNLSVSLSTTRLREIGVRKVLGSPRKQLIMQFLTESLLLSGSATLFSLGIYPIAKPSFEQVVGKSLLPLVSLPTSALFIPLVIAGLVGLLAGIYPAFLLSSQNVVDAMKSKLQSVNQKIRLRQLLVGFQFLIAAVVLIIAALVTQQVHYFFGQALGYNQAYVVSSQVPRDWSPAGVRKLESVRQIFAAMPEVASISLSHEIPNGNNGGQPMVYKNGTDSTQAVAMQALVADEHYLRTYQIGLVEGRFFDSRGLDSLSVVMNEKAVRAMGYKKPHEAIGRQIRAIGDPRLFTIAGITRNFHFNSMQQAIQPMVFFSVKGIPIYRYLSFKIHPGNISRSLEAIQKKWTILFPDAPFDYAFMDQTLQKLYRTELQLEKAAYVATALALLIVLLGIFGLVSLSVARRTKEVGIRKVLGASVPGIIGLFLKEYGWVLLITNIIACPLTYWVVSNWLADYAYHTQIDWPPFVGVGFILAILTGLVVSLQVVKTALMNPVKSLRTE
jgi:putative ABC transport system permease protein